VVSASPAKIRNRVIGLCCFQTLDSIFQTVLVNAVAKASALHIFIRDAKNFLNTGGGIHNSQGGREAVEEKGSARFVSLVISSLLELG
jgi:hypothetical protein